MTFKLVSQRTQRKTQSAQSFFLAFFAST